MPDDRSSRETDMVMMFVERPIGRRELFELRSRERNGMGS